MNHDNNIIQELRKYGINAEEAHVVKNNITCTGIRIIDEDSKIQPIVYYSPDETIEDIVTRIKGALQSRPMLPGVEELTDPDFIRQHVLLAVQQKSDDTEVIKRDLLNLELYLRVVVTDDEGSYSVKVTTSYLEASHLTEDEVWLYARQNSDFVIRSMADILGIDDPDFPFSVITDKTEKYGGAALSCTNVFHDWCCERKLEGCFILPSSTMELLVIPADESNPDPEMLANLVATVNQSDVDPLVRLEPVCYHYSVADDIISIAAYAGER